MESLQMELVKNLKMKSSWFRVDSKSNNCCPYKKKEDPGKHTGKKVM